jgi:hypothetical protein
MPERYHIKTHTIQPRRPRIGKCGIVDWREDCAGCHNCVKKACVFDRYRQESQYIKGLRDVDSFFFECMACFSCVQQCTKGLLSLSLNPEFQRLGNSYWTPEIIQTTWTQAETAKIPVSGAGYRGPFTGTGFDSMWTDMSEIVRPTRDGIHGREYISTAVDIGRKLPIVPTGKDSTKRAPPLIDIPMPLIIDMLPPEYDIPQLTPIFQEVAAQTGIITLVNTRNAATAADLSDANLPFTAFYIENGHSVPMEKLRKTRLAEISDSPDYINKIRELKVINPDIVVAIRVQLDTKGMPRAIQLAQDPATEVLHLVSDNNGNQIGNEKPLFIKDMVRQVHNALVKMGIRDEITIIAGGGIALAEHMAKQILCGADLTSINLPLLIGLECHLCKACNPAACPARINEITLEYGVGRMTNLIAAWHDQLIEVMGAMGIREARRLRGEVGRALFFEDLEEETFGRLFGTRKA